MSTKSMNRWSKFVIIMLAVVFLGDLTKTALTVAGSAFDGSTGNQYGGQEATIIINVKLARFVGLVDAKFLKVG